MDGLGHNVVNIAIEDIAHTIFIWAMNWLGLSLSIAYSYIKSTYDLTFELFNNMLSLL